MWLLLIPGLFLLGLRSSQEQPLLCYFRIPVSSATLKVYGDIWDLLQMNCSSYATGKELDNSFDCASLSSPRGTFQSFIYHLWFRPKYLDMGHTYVSNIYDIHFFIACVVGLDVSSLSALLITETFLLTAFIVFVSLSGDLLSYCFSSLHGF